MNNYVGIKWRNFMSEKWEESSRAAKQGLALEKS